MPNFELWHSCQQMNDMWGEWGNMKVISNHDSLQSVDYPSA
jgi:hypothetical protein